MVTFNTCKRFTTQRSLHSNGLPLHCITIGVDLKLGYAMSFASQRVWSKITKNRLVFHNHSANDIQSIKTLKTIDSSQEIFCLRKSKTTYA